MSDKVKLPREVANFIKSRESLRISSIYDLIVCGNQEEHEKLRNLLYKKFNINNFCDELMEALVNGYEVEITPEEQLKILFDEHWDLQKTFSLSCGDSKTICTTITKVLNILNIKIEGINE